jgi:hypothetical protein
MHVIRSLVSKKPPKEFLPEGAFTPKQTRRFLAALNKVATADGDPSPEMQAKLDAISGALALGGQSPKTTGSQTLRESERKTVVRNQNNASDPG